MENIYAERQLFIALFSAIFLGWGLVTWLKNGGSEGGGRGVYFNREETPLLFYFIITSASIWVLISILLACQALFYLALNYIRRG